MEKEQSNKNEMFLLRLPKEQKEKIFKVVEKSSYNSASELIRAGIKCKVSKYSICRSSSYWRGTPAFSIYDLDKKRRKKKLFC